MRTVFARYKGYIEDYFIFIVERKEIKFAPWEITALDVPLRELIKMMNRNIGHLYKLAVFWDSYGYYVIKNSNGEWELFDALTHVYTGTAYANIDNIPIKYMDKQVQRYQRKMLLMKMKS